MRRSRLLAARATGRRLLRAAPLLAVLACVPRAAPPAPPGGPGGGPAPGPTAGPPEDSIPPQLSRSWPAFGTTLQITLWDADTLAAAAAVVRARAEVARVDSLTAVYQEGSDLARVNRRAGTDSATVLRPATAAVLSAALRWAGRTGGALDPTASPLDALWAAYRSRGRDPPAPARDSAAALVGWRLVRFDSTRRSVRLPRRGMRLDLAPLAAGYALDRAVTVLRAAGLLRGSVELGGDIVFFGRPPAGDLWGIGLPDPRNRSDVFAVVTLAAGAVATAGSYAGLVGSGDARASRVVDPRSGRPAAPVAAATGLAPTALEAEALAAAMRILGPSAGCELAAETPGAEGLWVRDPGAPVDGRAPALGPGDLVATPALLGRLQFAIGGESVPAPEPCARP